MCQRTTHMFKCILFTHVMLTLLQHDVGICPATKNVFLDETLGHLSAFSVATGPDVFNEMLGHFHPCLWRQKTGISS